MNEISIGFNITPKIYLTLGNEEKSMGFEVNRIIDVYEDENETIIKYNLENSIETLFSVKENINDIKNTINMAENYKNLCIKYLLDISEEK